MSGIYYVEYFENIIGAFEQKSPQGFSNDCPVFPYCILDYTIYINLLHLKSIEGIKGLNQ